MNTINDGGPAFPTTEETGNKQDGFVTYMQSGMTLRDYFAAKVLNGLMSDGDFSKRDGETYAQAAARISYDYADAMIAARQTKETKE